MVADYSCRCDFIDDPVRKEGREEIIGGEWE